MNKKSLLLVVLISFILLLPSFVSAESEIVETLKQVGEGVWDIVEPLSAWLLGDVPGSDYMFAKLIFFLIILGIVWTVLDRIDFISENTWVVVLLSIAVSTLSIRYLATPALLEAMILPYSTFGVALAAGFPFVLYFFIVEVGLKDKVPTIRKVAWIIFAVVFIGLYFTRIDKLGELGTYATWIYGGTAVASLAMMAFDGSIQSVFSKISRERASRALLSGTKLKAMQDYQTALQLYGSGALTKRDLNEKKKIYENIMKT